MSCDLAEQIREAVKINITSYELSDWTAEIAAQARKAKATVEAAALALADLLDKGKKVWWCGVVGGDLRLCDPDWPHSDKKVCGWRILYDPKEAGDE